MDTNHPGQKPYRLTTALRAKILNATRKKPADGSTHWSCRKLANALGISKDVVHRVWREAGLKPHRLERYMAFDPYTGKQKPLRSIEVSPDCCQGMMSPDGSTFALVKGGQVDTRIRLFSLSGGSDREITVKGWPNIMSLDWSADGKGFYCRSASAEDSTLIYVDLRGTAHSVWRDRWTNWVCSFGIPSPDNRHLAIMGWVHNSNVWTIENF